MTQSLLPIFGANLPEVWLEEGNAFLEVWLQADAVDGLDACPHQTHPHHITQNRIRVLGDASISNGRREQLYKKGTCVAS